MCGIVGAVSLAKKPLDQSRFKPMCDAIAHRGPDDAGFFMANHRGSKISMTERKFGEQNPHLMEIQSHMGEQALQKEHWNLFLGHRRLSIIDLSSAGHQPMGDPLRENWLVYNGELYNYKELRSELVSLGFEFRTSTDTEVILQAYRTWGSECVHKFNGMFAFVIWDSRQNRLFLARDRYGIKPLYYTLLEDETFLFGSEIKAMTAYRPQAHTLDVDGVIEYFTFQNFFTDRTLHKDIQMLPAGHTMVLDLDTSATYISRYWDFEFHEDASLGDEAMLSEMLDARFSEAVKRQLVSDVELGTFLSGGIDSGSITAIAAQEMPYLKSFTIGFDLSSASGIEFNFDEREKAEYMSYLFKTEHYEMVLKSGDMERCMPHFSWHLEEPRVGQSYANYYACKLAGSFVKVTLAGTGGDELLGGYPWRYYRAVSNDGFDDYIDKYYQFWQRLIPQEQIPGIFAPIWNQSQKESGKEIFKGVFKEHFSSLNRPEDYVNHSLYFEAKTFLHGLLVVEDKLSMAHSLEARVPFLDNDLVDLIMRIPVRYKLSKLKEVIRVNENALEEKQSFFQKTNDGKNIFRKAMQKHITEEISKLTKQGFSAPDASWFKGESMTFVKNRLYDPSAQIYRYIDPKPTQKLLDEHLSGKQNRRLLIWSLLNFESFLEHYKL